MRSLVALLTVGLVSAGVTACGGADKSTGSKRPASSNAPTTKDAAASAIPWPKPRHLPSLATTRRYLRDPDLPVSVVRENSRIFAFYGEAADAVDRRAITAVVKRYYAVAVTGDGKRACAMIVPSFAKVIRLDYGQFGSPYLHSAKTCQAVLSRMFKHSHRELTGPLTVTGVLVKGDLAYALLGSAKMPASVINLLRERGTWMIDSPLGGAIPVAK